MKPWTKILPMFVVEWLAKRNLERFHYQATNETIVNPYKNVYFVVKKG
jgi:hypothetical protein